MGLCHAHMSNLDCMQYACASLSCAFSVQATYEAESAFWPAKDARTRGGVLNVLPNEMVCGNGNVRSALPPAD